MHTNDLLIFITSYHI